MVHLFTCFFHKTNKTSIIKMQCQHNYLQARNNNNKKSTPMQHKVQTTKPKQQRLALFSHCVPKSLLLPCTPTSSSSSIGPDVLWQFCLVYIYDYLHLLVWCDAKLFGLFYYFFQNRKLLSTFSYCKTFKYD
jgi:hypothetical protein